MRIQRLRFWRTQGVCLIALMAALALACTIPPHVQAATPGEFESLAASPEPLTSVTVDTATNIIYAQENEGTSFYSYDPSTGDWSELAPAPIGAGSKGGAAYLNGMIYVSYTGESAMLGVYDIATNTWTTIDNPLKVATADITASGEDLYMVEGTAFVSYNPATKATTKLAGAPRWFNSEGEDGAAPYCEEGFERWGGLQPFQGRIYGDQGNECKGFASYDIATNSWTELPDLPEGAVAGSALDPVTGTYFAYGPYGGSDFYGYDIASRQWTTISSPFNGVNDGGMAYVGLPGLHGIYAAQGEGRKAFARYVTLEPQGEAELSLTNSPSVTETAVGADITYTVHVTNGGPNEATNVIVSDPLPADVSVRSAGASAGNCSGTTTVSCDLGTLAAGGSATVTIEVEVTELGTATNTAEVSSEEPDPDTANNSQAAHTEVTTEADLSLTDTSSVPDTTVASHFTYTLRATNNGPSPATNVSLTDTLPSDVTLLSTPTSSQGSCEQSTKFTCSLGTLARGATATVTITVEAGDVGTATDSASVASEVRDPEPANNSATASTQITARPAAAPASTTSGGASTTSVLAATNTPTPALKPARLLVVGGVLRLARGSRSISAPLENLNSQLAISGSVQLLTYVSPGKGKASPGKGKASAVLASDSVHLAPGATKTLYLTLNGAALSKLRAEHRFNVELVMTLTDPEGRSVKASGVYLLEESPAKSQDEKHKT